MQNVSYKHDVIGIIIKDPREMFLPDIGLIELEDAETGEIMLVDTSSKAFRNEFQKTSSVDLKATINTFQASSIDYMIVKTDESPVDPIIKFFKMRSKRL